MNRFKKILVVVDQEVDNQALFDRAVALAKSNSGRLTFIEAIKGMPARMRLPGLSMSKTDVQELVVQHRQDQLTELVAPLRRRIEGVRVIERSGIPYLEIIKEVIRGKHDLVMVSSESEMGLRGRVFGSTSLHLMRKCPCPVWVMRPAETEKYDRILAAVDPDSNDDERDSLNTKIMDLATSMAKLEQSDLHIVHVWDYWGEGAMRAYRGASDEVIDKWVLETKSARETQLNGLLDQYSRRGIDQKVHFMKGDPGNLIPELANREKVDLIVMGTVCRTGIAGFFIGNTAENILQKVDCSVLAVKPDGFQSPVQLDE